MKELPNLLIVETLKAAGIGEDTSPEIYIGCYDQMVDLMNKGSSLFEAGFLVMLHSNTFDKGTTDKIAKTRSGFIYILRTSGGTKIGRTASKDKRYQELITNIPYDVLSWDIFPVKDMYSEEKNLHRKYKEKNINREWFDLNWQDYQQIKDALSPLFPSSSLKV